jgi:hypothetical protein
MGHFRPIDDVCAMSAILPIAAELLPLRQPKRWAKIGLPKPNRPRHRQQAHGCDVIALGFEDIASTDMPLSVCACFEPIILEVVVVALRNSYAHGFAPRFPVTGNVG